MSANPFGFRFDTGYAHLPETLFAFCDPQPVQARKRKQRVRMQHRLHPESG